MNTRHPNNPNLTLLKSPYWEGLRVQSQQGMLIEDYLLRIHNVVTNALEEHRRTCVFRVDLKFPSDGYEPDSSAITSFISSLKSQLEHDACRKQCDGRVHPCTLRYVWVREQHTSSHWHYHVAIFVNHDRFKAWGRFKSTAEYALHAANEVDCSINMADRMRKAWASALGISLVDSIGLVHFADTPYSIDVNADDFADRLNEVFYWLSYFAKVHTKHYGTRRRNFGRSQS